MAGQNEAVPVIIKRKKKVAGGGHHGGAWKVAYADFVTAMMAFFMLLWLLNATTEKQRKGIADYFNPTIPISRMSGGGESAFAGDSLLAEKELAANGATLKVPLPKGSGDGGEASAADASDETLGGDKGFLPELQQLLSGAGGESMISEQLLRHVVTRVTDEGLIVELHDLPGAPLFDGDAPRPVLEQLVTELAAAFNLVRNEIAVGGHVAARPVVSLGADAWALSGDRADRAMRLLTGAGVEPRRVQRVTGFADRKPALQNRMAPRNNRLEIILLRGRT
ncbi:flagellar motor protein MotB [Roseitranquillus sediminis]|uniref:flagellar motor protein MotB n=1 Tax=Roseitranquillus sediminis TaxID=2809051 RepID=UPI001D0C037A|nr:flagellar motor protein MotB [Roseitranquillus sediminis]MBM9596100.1 chemotaxis protein MotB [Roseitranquillus sediminis]